MSLITNASLLLVRCVLRFEPMDSAKTVTNHWSISLGHHESPVEIARVGERAPRGGRASHGGAVARQWIGQRQILIKKTHSGLSNPAGLICEPIAQARSTS
jgi:hypothetical protein